MHPTHSFGNISYLLDRDDKDYVMMLNKLCHNQNDGRPVCTAIVKYCSRNASFDTVSIIS